jgi:oligopeptidase B
MPPQPPFAKTEPSTTTHQRWTLVDPYAWLQDKTDPQVIAYLEAENAYARAVMQPTEPLQEQLFQEMRARIQEDDSSAPQLRGGYWYYARFNPGQQYRLFCRKQSSLDAAEEILLDENALAVGQPYCRVLTFEPSPDHTLLAYSVDTTGSLVFDLYIKDLRSGEQLAGPIPQVAMTAVWANDNRTLFYTVFDASHRAYKLFCHTLGEAGKGGQRPPDHPIISADRLVWHETDESFMLRITRSRSGAYLLVTIASQSSSEVRYLPADQPTADLAVIQPRQPWLEYYADHHGDRFLIRTNDHATNFKLVEAPVSNPGKGQWREIIPHRIDVMVESVLAFRDYLVVGERRQGLRRIRISAPDGLTDVRYVAFPEPVYAVYVDLFVGTFNPEFDTDLLRFEYSSLVTPDSTVEYNMRSASWDVKKVLEIPSGYDPSLYRSERLTATAPDGAQVPISLVYRKSGNLDILDGAVVQNIQISGSSPLLAPGLGGEKGAGGMRGAPLLLQAYGSYGFSSEAGFDPKHLSLLDRGFVIAIAHVRGGSELGRDWYEHGRLMHKKNTFTDFIACAEHLVAQGYTTPGQLAMMGGSAGGLLVSAVLNLRPDLFRAAVALVPFTNVITAMLMPDLPLTVIEYEQWGNPSDPEAFEYMLSYSPYENVEAKAYPAIFARAGLNDLQVPYWDPAKWVARLRALKTDSNPLLLVTNMAAGHGGSSGRYDHLREDAQHYAFLLTAIK